MSKIFVTCDNCGTEFEKYSNGSKHNFCCTGCKGKWQKTGLRGEDNPFYGKAHTIETKETIATKNIGRKYGDEINLKKGHPQQNNPAYNNGYWMIRKRHISQFKGEYCEDCGNTSNLEIHHEPYMDADNCLGWKGKVYTLCRGCHMDRHRDKNGKMVRIHA